MNKCLVFEIHDYTAQKGNTPLFFLFVTFFLFYIYFESSVCVFLNNVFSDV